MEDLFLKLNHPVSEELQVKFENLSENIRRNLRSEFISSLGLIGAPDVSRLKQYCKSIESDLRRIQMRNYNGPTSSGHAKAENQ